MAAEYQETDWRVVDYECFCLDPEIIDPSRFKPLFIRGPRPPSLEKGSYFVCLGAAQTFGRFCLRPFPSLLQERLGLPVLNVSHGGAGPSFFLHDKDRLLSYLNGARFVVLQVMSARSEGNSLFESRGVGHYRRKSDGTEMTSEAAFEELLRTQPSAVVARIVEETRSSWLSSYRALLSGLTAPTVLFWFSTRGPDNQSAGKGVRGLLGEYPQLVNRAMLGFLRAETRYFASCVSRRGLPHALTDRNTGKRVTISDPWSSAPWEKNWYYPSPSMHEDAARVLEHPCRIAAGLAPARSWWRLW